ncbi:MAG TPA: hypothetical protein VGK90_04605, partial [Rhizomicrobium sp.]
MAALVAILCLPAVTPAAGAKATYATFNLGGRFGTGAYAINDSGTVTGDYGYTSEQAHGFLRTPDGTITTFDPPDSTSTLPMGINSAGSIVGLYYGGSSGSGFIRSPDGTFTAFGVPDALTYPRSINLKGEVTGFYEGSDGVQAFVRSAKGKITKIIPTGSTETSTFSINS